MKKINCSVLFSIISTSVFSFSSAQQDKEGGMPPATGVLYPVKNGVITPENEFIGTFAFPGPQICC